MDNVSGQKNSSFKCIANIAAHDLHLDFFYFLNMNSLHQSNLPLPALQPPEANSQIPPFSSESPQPHSGAEEALLASSQMFLCRVLLISPPFVSSAHLGSAAPVSLVTIVLPEFQQLRQV